MDIKVEKGIPIPVSRRKRTLEWMEAMKKLNEGDSFTVEGKNAYTTPQAAGKALGYEMTFRMIGPDQYRLWVGKKGKAPGKS